MFEQTIFNGPVWVRSIGLFAQISEPRVPLITCVGVMFVISSPSHLKSQASDMRTPENRK